MEPNVKTRANILAWWMSAAEVIFQSFLTFKKPDINISVGMYESQQF
jgi:hypothetical protein